MKKCPFCAEEIQDEAILCRYCGKDLNEPSPAQRKTKFLRNKIINEKADKPIFLSAFFLFLITIIILYFVPLVYKVLTEKISANLARKTISSDLFLEIIIEYIAAYITVIVWRKLCSKGINKFFRLILSIITWVIVGFLLTAIITAFVEMVDEQINQQGNQISDYEESSLLSSINEISETQDLKELIISYDDLISIDPSLMEMLNPYPETIALSDKSDIPDLIDAHTIYYSYDNESDTAIFLFNVSIFTNPKTTNEYNINSRDDCYKKGNKVNWDKPNRIELPPITWICEGDSFYMLGSSWENYFFFVSLNKFPELTPDLASPVLILLGEKQYKNY